MKKIVAIFKSLMMIGLVSIMAFNVTDARISAADEAYKIYFDAKDFKGLGEGNPYILEDGSTILGIKITNPKNATTVNNMTGYSYMRPSDATDNTKDVLTFCIEPFVATASGEGYNPYQGDLDAVLTKEMRVLYQNISYFGYGYDGDVTPKAYLATQIAIWQAGGATVSKVKQEVLDMADAITKKAKAHIAQVQPVFASHDLVLKGYGEQHAITLTDTNGAFSEWFGGANEGGYNVRKNGDDLIVYATRGQSKPQGKLEFQDTDPAVTSASGVDILFTSPTEKQKLMKISGMNVSNLILNVRIESGTALISKQDITNQEELVGATLQVIDKESGNIIDQWVSDGTKHTIDNLVLGDYILKEISSPDGFTIAEEIEFTIREDGEIVSSVMFNDHTKIAINKYERSNGINTTRFVAGAHMQVIEKDTGIIVHDYISNKGSQLLFKVLAVNKTYILHEVSAPFGYTIAKDIEFTVQNVGLVQSVTMYDEIVREQPAIDGTDGTEEIDVTEGTEETDSTDGTDSVNENKSNEKSDTDKNSKMELGVKTSDSSTNGLWLMLMVVALILFKIRKKTI